MSRVQPRIESQASPKEASSLSHNYRKDSERERSSIIISHVQLIGIYSWAVLPASFTRFMVHQLQVIQPRRGFSRFPFASIQSSVTNHGPRFLATSRAIIYSNLSAVFSCIMDIRALCISQCRNSVGKCPLLARDLRYSYDTEDFPGLVL